MFPIQTYARKTDESRPKIALVLSGGGAKGFAHIGVLKVLEEEGIPIDIIVGTSMGSLIGGIYALGYNADEIEKLVKAQNWEQLLSDKVERQKLSFNEQQLKQRYLFSLSFSDIKSVGLPQGIIRGQNVMNLFCGLSGNFDPDTDFSKLPISYACVAADMETGEEVIMKNGFLPTALFASMAIPGVFQPISRDGLLLVDGGIVNNFPTDVAKEMGADIIIGVDLRGDFKSQDQLNSIDEIASQIIGFMGKEKNAVNKSLCDISIRPNITGYSVGSFSGDAADTLILRGEEATRNVIEQIHTLKKEYNLKPREYNRQFVVISKWLVSEVKFHSDCFLNETFLMDKLNMDIPGDYSYEQIKDAIDHLYGYGGFELIYFYLTDSENGKILHLNINPQKEFVQRIGFKVNTNDAAAIQLNFTRKNFEKPFDYLSASIELSANPGGNIVAETNRGDFPRLGIELKGKYQEYSIYEEGKKLYSADFFYTALDCYIYKSFLNTLNLGVGIQEEYFDGDVFSRNSSSLISSIETNELITATYAYFTFDDWDDFYFPSKGTRLDVRVSAYTKTKNFSRMHPALLFKLNKIIPLKQNVAVLFDYYSRMHLTEDFPLLKTTFVGGESYSQYFDYHLPFVGLPPVTVGDRYVNIALLGVRTRINKNQYVSLLYNMMAQGEDINSLDDFETTGGGGIKYSIKTVIGPIDIEVGYAQKYEKPTFSANVGLWF
nr:patatin-like phospholipase family protein [Maribellus sp. YY47]